MSGIKSEFDSSSQKETAFKNATSELVQPTSVMSKE